MASEVRCLHTHPPNGDSRLSVESEQRGIVVCVHPYGLGIYLPDQHIFGHVDAPLMGLSTVSGLDDYPPVGSVLPLKVLGYSGGAGQLRLSVST